MKYLLLLITAIMLNRSQQKKDILLFLEHVCISQKHFISLQMFFQ